MLVGNLRFGSLDDIVARLVLLTRLGHDQPGGWSLGQKQAVAQQRCQVGAGARTTFQLWRRPVGPGWSSFAVVGGMAFTMEQPGADQYAVALDVSP